MQSGHEPQLVASEHPVRHAHRNRVRDGVVGVEQPGAELLVDLDDLGRERLVVGRVLEQRILEDLHLVEVDGVHKPHRTLVRDQVNVAAAVSQLASELTRNASATADGGVADDADGIDHARMVAAPRPFRTNPRPRDSVEPQRHGRHPDPPRNRNNRSEATQQQRCNLVGSNFLSRAAFEHDL